MHLISSQEFLNIFLKFQRIPSSQSLFPQLPNQLLVLTRCVCICMPTSATLLRAIFPELRVSDPTKIGELLQLQLVNYVSSWPTQTTTLEDPSNPSKTTNAKGLSPRGNKTVSCPLQTLAGS
ncbi:uncharacterized protein LOC110653688 [Hevea brasiliensis]|uniref:uncharacterized protein LOC110653688 n=1 Tax=Hevea brasiliensis TaxID=3981 RepID=UPI0025DFF7B7|nr:uncharacterized protein LOC110653688 [Hevea brasiliensis]